MESFYNCIDVLICGSLSEAFGRVIIESMIRRVLVIARNVGGVPEIIEHGKHGLLYNDEKELSNWINWCYDNACKIEEIKQNAFEMVNERFSIKRYQQRTMEILLQ
jgi:glycosyltransferase involved in cell wall biosynthesis